MKYLPGFLGIVVILAVAGCVSPGAVAQKAPKKYEVTHTDAEWKKLLPRRAYVVLRHSGTEDPFTGELLNVHEKGTFVCAGCGQKLFLSETKFDSGTGWPSFWAPINQKAIDEVEDLRDPGQTEVKCSKCGGHLGHVFNDGPKPTGLRFCMNSVAMKFIPDEKK